MNEPPQPESRLARRLGTFDAVVIGLGAMIGAGVFAAIGPAAAAAGGGLLIGLGIAAVVAYCNATSSARLAALYPHSGGTYVYGRERLGPAWGFLAGWAFVIGKTASCAAIALTFGAYIDPDFARPLAVGAVVALTAVNLFGVQRATTLVKVMVAIVLGSLAVVVMSSATSSPSVSNIGPLDAGGIRGTLRGCRAPLLRLRGIRRASPPSATRSRDPVRAIPRAIPIALGITLLVYAAVAFAALVAVGPEALAVSDAPLSTVAEAGTLDWAEPVVRIGATVASLGVLMSLLLGVSRTLFAMGGGGDLPHWLDAVHVTHRVPHHAVAAVAVAVIAVVLVADLRGAIGFSSFTVLTYYAIANASALTLTDDERRRRSRATAVLGLVGCAALAFALPASSVIVGAALLVAGILAWALVRATSQRPGR